MIAEPASGEPTLGMLRGLVSREEQIRFAVDGLRPGEYVIRLIGGTIKSVTWDGKDYTYTPFNASSGRDIDGVVITTTSQTVAINGVVRDGQGRASPGAAVIYFPVEREQWRRFGLQPSRLRSIATSRKASMPGRR